MKEHQRTRLSPARTMIRCLGLAIVMQGLWLLAGCCLHEEIIRSWEMIEVTTLENTGTLPAEATGDSIPHQAFGLRLLLGSGPPVASRFSSALLPAACATSCEPTIRYRERVEAFSIRKLVGRDSASTVSVNVTNDFVGRDSRNGAFNPRLHDFWPAGEFTSRVTTPGSTDFFLVRNQAPERDVRFVITAELSDGRRLADTTDYLALL